MKKISITLILLSSVAMSDMCQIQIEGGTKAVKEAIMYVKAEQMALAQSSANIAQINHVGTETECSASVLAEIRESKKKDEATLIQMGLLKASIY